ncbi:MAG TPA: DivIVA domain-containing protein [Cyclobacteriaceae bacterium]|nr:DivIVA domain-containing protein [Cyclobacteriaceae bacterium]
MKITPLEIRQKTFERTLRGYDKDEVNAFLLSLSQEWERMQDGVKEMKMKFESAEREVVKLREVENTLFRTLKTAEDTGASVIDQANKSAELHVRESQMRAEGMINEAKSRARSIMEDAEMTTRQLLEEMEEKLKGLADQYKTMELHRDNLLADLKRFAGETIDRVERAKNVTRDFNPDSFLLTARREAKKVMFPNEIEQATRKVLAEPPVEKVVPAEKITIETKVAYAEANGTSAQPRVPKSFFDDIQ